MNWKYTCPQAALRAAMVRALNVGVSVHLSDPVARAAAYHRAEITDYSPEDDEDAVNVAMIWRTKIANAERTKVA